MMQLKYLVISYFHDRKKTLYLSAFIIILLAAIIIRANVIYKHRFPGGDEGSWIRMADNFPGKWFLQSNVVQHDLYSKHILPHPEDNRSILFPILMAILNLLVSDTFLSGQCISFLSFLLLCLFIGLYFERIIGRMASIITLLLLSFSPLMVEYSTQVYPDILMAIGFFFILLYVPKSTESTRNAFGGGLFLGLLFLLKNTAIFLLPVFAIYFWKARKGDKLILRIICFLFPFLCCSVPWIIRNIILFHSPLFQFTNYALFIDNIHDLFKVGIQTPTFQSYFDNHGLVFIFLKRPFLGFLAMLRKFPYFDSYLSLIILPFSIAGIKYIKPNARLYMPPLLFSFFLLPPISSFAYVGWVHRYVLVYYIWLYIMAGIGAKVIFDLFKHKIFAYGFIITITLVFLSPTIYPCEFYLSGRGNEHQREMSAREIISEAKGYVPDSVAVISSFLEGFYTIHNMKTVNLLNFDKWEDIEAILNSYNVQFALLETKTDEKFISLFQLSGKKNLIFISESGPFSFYKIK